MTRPRSIVVPALLWLLPACGQQSNVPAEGAGTASGTGGASATASASTSTGAGGACTGAFIDVKPWADGSTSNAPHHLTQSCAATWGAGASSGPVGYRALGASLLHPWELVIEGCPAPSEGFGLHMHFDLQTLDADAGTIFGYGTYENSCIGQISAASIDATAPVGGLLEGMFSGIVEPNCQGLPPAHADVTFRVCRIDDQGEP